MQPLSLNHFNFEKCSSVFLGDLANGWFSLWFPGGFNDVFNCSNCHLVKIEGNSTIFEVVLAPLRDVNPLVTRGSVPHSTNLADDNEPIWKVAKQS